MATWLILGGGIIIIVMGLRQIYDLDGTWRSYQKWARRAEGVRVERTPEWDEITISKGKVLVAIGVILGGMPLWGGLLGRLFQAIWGD